LFVFVLLRIAQQPVVGLVQGHGEPALSAFQQVYASLDVLYNVEPVTLTDTLDLQKFTALAIVAPADSFPSEDLNVLDKYMANGGNG